MERKQKHIFVLFSAPSQLLSLIQTRYLDTAFTRLEGRGAIRVQQELEERRSSAMHTTATARTSEITGRQQQPLLLSPLCYRQKTRGYQSVVIFEKQIYIAVQAIRLAVKMTKGTKRPHGQDYFYSTGSV